MKPPTKKVTEAGSDVLLYNYQQEQSMKESETMKTIDIATIVTKIAEANTGRIADYWVHLQLQKIAKQFKGPWSREMDEEYVMLLVGILFERFPTLNKI